MKNVTRSGSSRAGVVGLALAIGLLSGCVVSPTNGQLWNGSVSGFANQANATIKITAWNNTTHVFDLIATTTAGSSPLVQAGTMCSNSPALYYYSINNVTIPDADWNHASTDPTASLQVVEVQSGGTTQVLYNTTNSNGIQCMENNITPNCNYYDVAYNKCGYTLTETGVYIIG